MMGGERGGEGRTGKERMVVTRRVRRDFYSLPVRRSCGMAWACKLLRVRLGWANHVLRVRLGWADHVRHVRLGWRQAEANGFFLGPRCRGSTSLPPGWEAKGSAQNATTAATCLKGPLRMLPSAPNGRHALVRRGAGARRRDGTASVRGGHTRTVRVNHPDTIAAAERHRLNSFLVRACEAARAACAGPWFPSFACLPRDSLLECAVPLRRHELLVVVRVHTAVG